MKSLIVKRMLLGILCVCLACTLATSFAPAKTAHAAAARSLCGTTLQWGTGAYWAPGHSVTAYTCSGYGVTLTYQTDNNFVLYYDASGSNHIAIWSTGTYGSVVKPDYVEFQPDGNLVVYSYVPYYANGITYYYVAPQWASGTAGKGATNLKLQSDGNLVIYKGSQALWASNTCCY